MATGYNPIGGSFTVPDKPGEEGASFGDPSTFAAAVKTQGSDYDKIMQMYSNIAATALGNKANVGYSPITAQLGSYSESPDVASSISNLGELSSSGGYTPQGIQDIRARAISPIRSIYANAQRNIERQRALQGGYSPNFGALTAKLARDEASQIGDITTNANAAIAQNVAANRISSAPGYASAAAAENSARNAVTNRNADIINQNNMFNAGNLLDAQKFAAQFGLNNQNAALAATSGMANLYGTTPALVNTFGNQVSNATQLNQGQQNLNNQKLISYNRLGGGNF